VIDLSVDAAESYGRCTLGDDFALPHICCRLPGGVRPPRRRSRDHPPHLALAAEHRSPSAPI